MSKKRSNPKSEVEEENVLRAINMVETGDYKAQQAAEICLGFYRKNYRECGKRSVTNFLQRYPGYKLRTASARNIKRSAVEEESLIETWFSRAEQKLTELKADENIIYNYDEHKIRIGVGGKQKVVAPMDIKQPALGTQTGRESATILETICANGKFLLPLIIFKDKFVQAKWIYEHAKQNLPKDYLRATSKRVVY
ncbi:hypothetical protein K3495_g1712 [Podosphaera aphanis]|nr:hypothetical protein K3495_g1712 [Podosphaera aphanis]